MSRIPPPPSLPPAPFFSFAPLPLPRPSISQVPPWQLQGVFTFPSEFQPALSTVFAPFRSGTRMVVSALGSGVMLLFDMTDPYQPILLDSQLLPEGSRPGPNGVLQTCV